MTWAQLRSAVRKAVQWLDPPPQHWLESDPGLSYCWSCAVQISAAELGVALPYFMPPHCGKYGEIEERVDGGDWYSAISDGTVQCQTCGCTLHYWLSDGALEEEISYWIEQEDWGYPPNLSETAYALDRLFEASRDEDRTAVRRFAERFLEHCAEVSAEVGAAA